MIPTFGERLRNLRLSRNFSQGDLAKRIGRNISMIGLYENSSRMPSYETLIRIARTFGVSTDYLLGVEPQNDNPFNLDGLTESQAESVLRMIDEYRKANGRE
ncbi:helix-turn-helix domain-containing protein [Ruminococcaceae bacterium OttesenSCG-928-L11]|nr:helix-turn-helix domain-containing protein [Ruminococcaceae bacterium OttesenSCG-928-L11]